MVPALLGRNQVIFIELNNAILVSQAQIVSS